MTAAGDQYGMAPVDPARERIEIDQILVRTALHHGAEGCLPQSPAIPLCGNGSDERGGW